MTKVLRISKDLSLPVDFVTKTCGILAQRRKGKTYTASVIAEELVAAKVPWVALDPTGAWWGLRAGTDEKNTGLPVIIFGGQHADVPLEQTGGKVVADLVIDSPGFYVVDFSLFESKEAERQFATEFAERLYRLKKQAGKNFAMHLFVDEADMFIPQQSPSGDKRMLGAFEALVRRGGLSGLGTTLISQRAAVVNKNVLEQLDILIVLRNVGPNDRKAIDGYISAKGSDLERKEMMGSLASLGLGEAWVWEPGAEPPLFDRVVIRERHTFNSSATPKAGERRVEPRQLAEVDINAVTQRMAATIQKAKADDPKELRAQIATLERDLKRVRETREVLPTEPQVIEKPVVLGAYINRLEALRLATAELAEKLADAQQATATETAKINQALIDAKALNSSQATPLKLKEKRYWPTPSTTKVDVAKLRHATGAHSVASANGDLKISKKQQEILDALAWFESIGNNRPSGLQVGSVAMIDASGGHFSNTVGPLSAQGLIERGSGEIWLTDAGRKIARVPDSIGTLDEYHDVLRRRVRRVKRASSRTVDILNAIIALDGADVSTEYIGKTVGIDHTGGHFSNTIGPLSTLGLIERSAGMVRPTEILFPQGLR